MLASKWAYEIMLIVYSISLIGYFIDFMKTNHRVNKLSLYLLCLVWIIQSSILFYQTIIEKNFPILTLNDGLFFYAWLLLIFSLIINHLFQVHFVVLFTNIFSYFILLLSLSLSAQSELYEEGSQFVHEILVTHITLSIASYVFFTISFILSCMYLIQYYFLKRKKGLKWLWRFNDLEKLDAFSFFFIMIGIPLLSIGLIFGFVWAYVAKATFYWVDAKTIGSMIVLFVYIVYLMLRMLNGYRGKPISIYNAGAFLFLLTNFFLFSTLSGFHF